MPAIDINKEQFERLIREEKPLLVEFWAPWCGYCRRIGPAYQKVAEEYAQQLVAARVNIDLEPQLADAQQIEVVPTLVLYRAAAAVDSIAAPESKAAIDRFIKAALEH